MAADSSLSALCLHSNITLAISNAIMGTRILIYLPLSVLILLLGYHRWWRQRCSFATTSHSDIFTYHLAAMQLIFVLGATFYFSGEPDADEFSAVSYVGVYIMSFHFPGELSFHMLTCMERYLAVVHPVTYLRLKQSGGVRIRNISIGCVWLLCFGWMGVTVVYKIAYNAFIYILPFFLVVVSFCSLSVLRVLILPGPGEVGGDRQRACQSKRRAFHTVTAILGVLSVSFLGLLFSIAVKHSSLLTHLNGCIVMVSMHWSFLPSSLVLPLLFLQRAGKPGCGRYRKKGEQ